MSLRRRMEDDIERDFRDHIEMETRENIERGMTLSEARAAALRKFGNPLRIAEDTRAVWGPGWVERLLQDTRYAPRALRRNPVFAVIVILTLALGIGLNTAVFSVVNAVLTEPLAYPHPERLLWLTNYNKAFKVEIAGGPDFVEGAPERSPSTRCSAMNTAKRRSTSAIPPINRWWSRSRVTSGP